jgi:hypothetical protein
MLQQPIISKRLFLCTRKGDEMRARWKAVFVVALLLMIGGRGNSRAQALGEFRDNKEWVQFVHHLVNQYYPNVPYNLNLPNGYTLAFVLKDRDTVLRHTSAVLHEAVGTPLLQTVSRIFPDAGIDPTAPMEQGSLCVKEDPGKHGRYCVMYVVPPRRNPSKTQT